MVRIYRYALPLLDVIHPFQYREPVPNADNTHLFQFFVPQGNYGFTDYLVLCTAVNISIYIDKPGSANEFRMRTQEVIAVLRQPETRYPVRTLIC